MNVAEKLSAVVGWLNYQNESLSFGLRNTADAIKLYDYWQEHSDILPEYADEESDDEEVSVSMHRAHCLGYDPLA